jgi:hypothetical protein
LFFLCQFLALIENHGSGSKVVLCFSEKCWSRVHNALLPLPVGSFSQKTVNRSALVLTNTSIAQRSSDLNLQRTTSSGFKIILE